jgi:hypothetical protein
LTPQGGLASLPTRQAFDIGLKQRQLQCETFDDWILVAHMSNVIGDSDLDSDLDSACWGGMYYTGPLLECAEYHGKEVECEARSGCKTCKESEGMYLFCIKEQTTCCEETANDNLGCVMANVDPETNTIPPLNPNTNCFWCPADDSNDYGSYGDGICMTGKCCEPIEDESGCNDLENCYWDMVDDHCIAQGMQGMLQPKTGGGCEYTTNHFNPEYNYEANPFVVEPDATTPDFYRPFPIATPASQIKFSTGDGSIEAIADWSTFKALIDAKENDWVRNIDFTLIESGVSSEVRGIVNSDIYGSIIITCARNTPTPFITLWAENNIDSGAYRAPFSVGLELKITHGGMNVHIKECDPLGNLGSFSKDYASLTAGEGAGAYSLATSFAPLSPVTGRKLVIQIYSHEPGLFGTADKSCPSVNKDAIKVGNDINQELIDLSGSTGINQATGLEIDTEDLLSAPGSVSFSFAFTSGFGTLGTSNIYRGTTDADGCDDAGNCDAELPYVAFYHFCVRQILQLGDDSGKVLVVDVMEVPLSFTVKLDGEFELTSGFDVQSVSVAGDAKEIDVSYTVDIYQCAFPTAATFPITPKYNQGDVVELCIRSSNYPLASVVDILTLDFTVVDVKGVTVKYEAIDSALTDFDKSTDCGTFINDGGLTEQICGVRVLLPINIFFAAGSGPDTRKVTVTGRSLLEVGDSGRRLATAGGSLGRREMQEGGEQEASFSMSVETVVPQNSGGVSMTVASAAGAMTAAIAVLLI